MTKIMTKGERINTANDIVSVALALAISAGVVMGALALMDMNLSLAPSPLAGMGREFARLLSVVVLAVLLITIPAFIIRWLRYYIRQSIDSATQAFERLERIRQYHMEQIRQEELQGQRNAQMPISTIV